MYTLYPLAPMVMLGLALATWLKSNQNPIDSPSSRMDGRVPHTSRRVNKYRRLLWRTATLTGMVLLALDASAWAAEKHYHRKLPQRQSVTTDEHVNWVRSAQNAEEEEDKNFGANDSEYEGEENDENRKFSINTVVAGGAQCQNLSGDTATLEEDFRAPDTCKAALPLQLELSFRPDSSSEFHAKLGSANNNGLNLVSPFALSNWAASLEDDVKDINGRGRNYLLEAWYKRRFTLQKDATLDVTGGIIDATNYLDDNAYANDEYAQFMNEAFVNAPTAFLPSYDVGGAAQLDVGQWSLRAVAMNVGENEDGNNYNFFGGQIGYTTITALGEGTYRMVFGGTSKDFLDSDGFEEKKRTQFMLSFDQELGDTVGVFLRVGWQDHDAAVNHDALYSAGIDIGGKAWGRKDDNIGVGYAYLSGGNLDIASTQIAEVYYRIALNDNLALTADLQYVKDEIRHTKGPKGLIFGLRGVVQF